MCTSNNSNADAILSEQHLDAHFLSDVRSLVALVAKLPRKELVLPLCTKWLHIFLQVTRAEKIARNGLMELMHRQLLVYENLCEPFTLVSNERPDLLHIYHNLAQWPRQAGKAEPNQQTTRGIQCGGEEDAAPSWQCEAVAPNVDSNEIANVVSYNANLDELNKLLLEKNYQLSSQQDLLKANLCKLEKRKTHLVKYKEALSNENRMYNKEVSYLRDIFAASVVTMLKTSKKTHNETIDKHFFSSLFSAFVDDIRYTQQIRELDRRLICVMQISSDDDILMKPEKKIVQQTSGDYDKLKKEIEQKYKKAMIIHHSAQAKLLALIEMRYLSVLRKIFMDTFNGDEEQVRSVLRLQHKKYKETASQL